MEKWKKFGKKLLFPKWSLILGLLILSVVMLWYAFGYERPNPIITYLGYAISAYTLTVFVIKMPPVFRKVRADLYTNKYSGRYLSDTYLRANISLYAGFGFNLIYAVLKLMAGIYYKSVWIGAIAVYYMILSLMRFGLIKRQRAIRKYPEEKQRVYGLRGYCLCGYLVFVLNIAVTGLVVQLIWQNKSYSYPGFLIYAFAAYAFYCLITAVRNMARYRKLEDPILSAAKMLSFACALISILAMQTAMLTQFGEGQDNFARLMNSLTGGSVCLLLFGMAIWMVRRANRELKEMRGKNYGKL